MKKTVLLASGIGLIIIISGLVWWWGKLQSLQSLNTPVTQKEIVPSDTTIEYIDPSGFSFSYPDNLSIINNLTGETPDPDAYADLQIFSKDKSGSLSLRITDTKLATISAWLKENNISDTNQPTEKKLGDLPAFEVKTTDHLMLASIDQGILFTLEMPLLEQPFWNQVYGKVLSDFTFIRPNTTSSQASTQTSGDEVVFEGEEVVE